MCSGKSSVSEQFRQMLYDLVPPSHIKFHLSKMAGSEYSNGICNFCVCLNLTYPMVLIDFSSSLYLAMALTSSKVTGIELLRFLAFLANSIGCLVSMDSNMYRYPLHLTPLYINMNFVCFKSAQRKLIFSIGAIGNKYVWDSLSFLHE
ncbi:hypothetical protein TNIN_369031 [Trichonephila inaurata madagascariensis]|uniref:Uncharacterized protein n=1 Tax=Trichonephila inaurata madagascariensis TaxID=2747483 RepID=A0A8X6WQA1_9ARAC|nr:hypothetical protein TNIN_369031 [Trichonephila inaurata madagascariensis]